MVYPRRGGWRRPARRRREPAFRKPMPLPDGKCNPLCPMFRCLNSSLVSVKRVIHGRVQRVPMCRWIGDQCIGGTCQYASCIAKALLPDGSCLYAREKGRREEAEEQIESELMKEEQEMSRIERMMKRRGYSIDDDLI